MSDFLIDTLVWTGALLALVLLIRRPVAAVFGPRAAYALWALPMARLLLPPLVLPAWMAPASEPAADAAFDAASDTAYDPAVDMTAAALDSATAAVPMLNEPALLSTVTGFDWASVLIPLWLVGAAVFLIRRYALYFQMRRELLDDARPVGEAGAVRLVETPATDGPVAFGVLDKVVALPPGFMATRDRAARDLALAHELAHHRGHDLVCNMVVQPLFALHWFTPLAALGWRALRRDQEAACDARVIACQPRESRAAYATVIARFATQPRDRTRLALAAPMACPVLGDRSIVQRLKSLAMTDISARRRWSGRLLISVAALALPLTGSISYAQSDAAPTAPVAPVAPAAPIAPTAPVAPEAPRPPKALHSDDGRAVGEHRVVVHRIERDGQPVRIERRIYRGDKLMTEDISGELDHQMSAEERAEFEQDMAEHRADLAEMHRELAAEQAEMQREMAQEQAEMRREMAREQVEIQREVRLAVAEARRASPKVRVHCRDGQREVAETVTTRDGQTIFVCQAVAMAEARKGLAEARAEIARSRDLSKKERAKALWAIEHAERSTRAD